MVKKVNWGRNALHEAAEAGDLACCKALCSSPDLLNQKDNHGKTAMHYAAEQGHEAIVRLFGNLQSSVLDQVDDLGRTPAHYAAAGGHVPVLKYLHQRGADLNLVDDLHWTPLQYAVRRGHTQVALGFESSEVALDTENERDRAALLDCIKRSSKELERSRVRPKTTSTLKTAESPEDVLNVQIEGMLFKLALLQETPRRSGHAPLSYASTQVLSRFLNEAKARYASTEITEEEKQVLYEALHATHQFFRGRMTISEYQRIAERMPGATNGSKGLKVLGGLMIALGVVCLVAAVALAVPTPVIAAGVASGLVGCGMFNLARPQLEEGLAYQMAQCAGL